MLLSVLLKAPQAHSLCQASPNRAVSPARVPECFRSTMAAISRPYHRGSTLLLLCCTRKPVEREIGLRSHGPERIMQGAYQSSTVRLGRAGQDVSMVFLHDFTAVRSSRCVHPFFQGRKIQARSHGKGYCPRRRQYANTRDHPSGRPGGHHDSQACQRRPERYRACPRAVVRPR